MRKILNILTISVQAGLTFVAIFCLYMLFAVFDYKGGVANFVGLTLFQPLLGIIFSGLTVLGCLLIGLPIRMNRKLNNWWKKHFYISILLIFVGLIFSAISLTPQFIEEISYRMDGMDFEDTIPNRLLSITGWTFLAIGTLHLFPPPSLEEKVKNWIEQNLKNKKTHHNIT